MPYIPYGPQTYYATTLAFHDVILFASLRIVASRTMAEKPTRSHRIAERKNTHIYIYSSKKGGVREKKYSACPRADRISLIVIVISWRGVVFGAFLTAGVLPTDGCLFECHRGLLYASLPVLRDGLFDQSFSIPLVFLAPTCFSLFPSYYDSFLSCSKTGIHKIYVKCNVEDNTSVH